MVSSIWTALVTSIQVPEPGELVFFVFMGGWSAYPLEISKLATVKRCIQRGSYLIMFNIVDPTSQTWTNVLMPTEVPPQSTEQDLSALKKG